MTENTNNMRDLLDAIVEIAVAAGKEILKVYNQDFDVESKGDGSPLTTADRRAHELIMSKLDNFQPSYPVLSEESSGIDYPQRAQWRRFWLVDPLDGTKEFVKRNGEFTVNIALIDDGEPILGVVHTPAQDVTHAAAQGIGAFHIDEKGEYQPISTKSYNSGEATMVASRSHAGAAVDEYRKHLEQQVGKVSIQSMGSALKICLVAEGRADVYPRLGPTSEWDTAAAHCVLNVAGGKVVDCAGEPLRYNKENILNPWFFAIGDTSFDWLNIMDFSTYTVNS